MDKCKNKTVLIEFQNILTTEMLKEMYTFTTNLLKELFSISNGIKDIPTKVAIWKYINIAIKWELTMSKSTFITNELAIYLLVRV